MLETNLYEIAINHRSYFFRIVYSYELVGYYHIKMNDSVDRSPEGKDLMSEFEMSEWDGVGGRGVQEIFLGIQPSIVGYLIFFL